MQDLDIIILAAGKGTRMKSSEAKVLCPLGGKPLLQHVLETAKQLSPQNIYIVYGHQAEKVHDFINDFEHASTSKKIQLIHQETQLGTAHAVMQVLPYLNHPKQKVLILYGDVPLITVKTLENLVQQMKHNDIAFLTAHLDDPYGLGRIVRNPQGRVVKVVEEKDADAHQKNIKEINSGIYLTTASYLQKTLPEITTHNAQNEYYLTDIINENADIANIVVDDNIEIQGVNDLQQLYLLECYYQKMRAKDFRLSGVMVGQEVIFEGEVKIGAGSKIGPFCVLKNVVIGENVEIKSHCVIENAVIENQAKVGPFARIRPGTTLAQSVTVGNFTEIKNSHIGKLSKVPHLSYVGDTHMGEKVNFGAGAITCNYDGVNKYKTEIGDNVFIGSDTQLIAPVKIESGAFIGAGSTITKTAPKDKLTLSRAKQVTLEHWVKPIAEKEKEGR